MKLFTRILSLLAVASLALFFASCGSDDPKPPKQKKALAKFSKTWNLQTATLTEEGERTEDFSDFKLKISGTFNSSNPDGPYDYEVTGTAPDPSPWKMGAGKWKFVTIGASENLILRDPGPSDELGMTYSIGSDGKLTVKFYVDPTAGWEGGRAAQVSGNWVFVFTPAP